MLIVRPPGQPPKIKVFTEEQRGEAEQYAAGLGAVMEDLPLPYPDNWPGPLTDDDSGPRKDVAPERC